MKKLFLFITASTLVFSLSSCSSDNVNPSSPDIGGNITLKIDGVTNTFDNVIVDEEQYNVTGTEFLLTITATKGTSTSELITFKIFKGDLGSDALYSSYYLQYRKNNKTYRSNNETFVVQTNSADNKLKGYFSGEFLNNETDPATSVQVKDATFDIQY